MYCRAACRLAGGLWVAKEGLSRRIGFAGLGHETKQLWHKWAKCHGEKGEKACI